MNYRFALVILFIFAMVWYQFYDTSFACYDGKNPPLIFLGAPVDRMQIGVSPEGYPITCDGITHRGSGCSLMFNSLCLINSSMQEPHQ